MSDPVENKSKLGELPSLLGDLKDLVFERIKNPFLASISVFWLVINWKIPFYLLFSKVDIEKKFDVISDDYSNLENIFFYPLVLAMLYIFYKDKVFNFLEKVTNDSFVKRKETEVEKTIRLLDLEKMKVDKLNELKDAQDKNKLRDEVLKFEKFFEDQKQKNQELIKYNSNLEGTREKLFSIINNNTSLDLDDSRIKYVIKDLGNHQNLMEFGKKLFDLKGRVGDTLNKVDINLLNEIAKREYAQFDIVSDNKLGNFYLTFEGRFLVSYYLFNEENIFVNDLKIKKIY